jgi:eukaryotic-like serine/threonine-protein kinase
MLSGPELFADRYRIERKIGSGGMADVFLAEDVRNRRRVALKMLRPELTASVSVERFRREIEIAAQLQHPHILPLLDSGSDDGHLFFVMPLVEGRSLPDRLAQGPLPQQEALRLLAEVCDALTHAHSRGVVHRDIKPDNILLSGYHALITDFGIAKAVAFSADAQRLTATGIAVGTPAYMSPEQASGQVDVDQRSDIYSAGVVAYEMLAGRPPFMGTAQKVIAAHIVETPAPLSTYRHDVSPEIEQVIMRCLEKHPQNRWNTAEELLAQLTPLIHPSSERPSPLAWVLRRRSSLAMAAVAVTGLFALPSILRGPTAVVIGKVAAATSEPGLEISPALSPDGRLVAYAAGDLSRLKVFVRPVSGGRAIAIAADSATAYWGPKWAPDGSSILVRSPGKAWLVAPTGGPLREILGVRGGSLPFVGWSPDGRELVFVRNESLFVRAVEGRAVRFIGRPDERAGRDRQLHSCDWSVRGYIACVSGNVSYANSASGFGNIAPSYIAVFPAQGGAPIAVTDSNAMHMSPVWSPDGRWLYFVSDKEGPRDIYAVRVSAHAKPANQPLRLTTGANAHSIAVAPKGDRLAYSVYTPRVNVWSVPLSKGGSATRPLAHTSGTQVVEQVSVSSDGKWLYYDSDLKGNADIYRVRTSGGEAQQLTFDDADDFAPHISLDGREVAFHSRRTGNRDIFVMPAEGGAAEQVTFTGVDEINPRWSPDRSALVTIVAGGLQLLRRGATGQWKAAPFWLPRANPSWGTPEWSPDGRRLVTTRPGLGSVAQEDPTGGVGEARYAGWRIVVVPVDSGASQVVYEQPPGGAQPLIPTWSHDGAFIYFKSADATTTSFWAVPLAGGPPRLLARADSSVRSLHVSWSTDGKRFFFTAADHQSDIWVAELTRPP